MSDGQRTLSRWARWTAGVVIPKSNSVANVGKSFFSKVWVFFVFCFGDVLFSKGFRGCSEVFLSMVLLFG